MECCGSCNNLEPHDFPNIINPKYTVVDHAATEHDISEFERTHKKVPEVPILDIPALTINGFSRDYSLEAAEIAEREFEQLHSTRAAIVIPRKTYKTVVYPPEEIEYEQQLRKTHNLPTVKKVGYLKCRICETIYTKCKICKIYTSNCDKFKRCVHCASKKSSLANSMGFQLTFKPAVK